MDFFSSCSTQEEAKETFRTLSKHFHPDKGGDPKLMMELTSQFEQFPKKRTHNFNEINYSKERNRLASESKTDCYEYKSRYELESKLRGCEHQIQVMAITIIDLKTEKIRANEQLENVKLMNFWSRLRFFVFGVKYFNYYLEEN